MVGDHMSLARFKVQQTPVTTGTVYKVDAWLVYGDSDLFTTDGSGNSICHGGAGTQYCATAQITTDVAGRIY